MSWQPILDDEPVVRARELMREIALALASHTEPAEDLALYWAYTCSTFPDLEGHYDAAVERLSERIARGYARPALYGGAAGAGWVVAHVAEDADELLALIDSALVTTLDVERWTVDYDLINGLVGLGVYFLERGAAGRAGLDRVVDHLAWTATETGDLITWHTAPELLPAHQRVTAPAGYYNCGLAHGVPGVVAMLSRIAGDARADRLRHGAARWLDAQRAQLPDSMYPATVIETRPTPGRTAWCYGDPGVLLALWRSSRSTEYQELAVAALSRSVERAHVFDADLCHGAAGLAHMANRFYQATRDPRFRELARFWLARVVDFRTDEGIAGFRSWANTEWRENVSLLEGPLGIGLALQAAIADVEPSWDRLMLCDLPVAS